MSQYDPYAESHILTASPLELVRTLYRFVIDNAREAGSCVRKGDIEGRGRAVSRATDGLLELLTSLDHRQGGQVSRSLAELYGYMAALLLQGHVDQTSAPFDEVEKLMTTLAEGWANIGGPECATPYAAPYGSTSEVYAPVNSCF